MVGPSRLRVTTLNVRGLVSKYKREKLFLWLENNNNDIICIQETHCTKAKLEYFKESWKGLSYYSLTKSSHSKGVGILFKKQLDVNIDNVVEGGDGRLLLINCTINDVPITIVSCYAPNVENERVAWFKETQTWISKHANYIDELIICGDFNCCLGSNDRSTGTHLMDKSRKSFRMFIEHFELFDTITVNNRDINRYTWTDGKVQSRLDYILMKKDSNVIIKSLRHTTVISDNKSQRVTDHKAVQINCQLETDRRGPGYWKLNVSLLNNNDYRSEVMILINEMGKIKITNARLRWEHFKIRIKELSIKFSSKIAKSEKSDIQKIEGKLAELDELKVHTDDQIMEKYRMQNILHAYYEKASLGAQIRSRIDIETKGEANYKLMKAMEKSKQAKNTIFSLTNDKNETLHSNQKILTEIGNFYSNLYASKNIDSVKTKEYLQNVAELPTVSDSQREQLERPLTKNEFSEIVKHLKSNKSPGYDGIPNEFYQMFWNHIEPLYMSMIDECWTEGSLPATMNVSVLTLIHKGDSRDRISNYRPISLTNTDYKLVAFVFAQRLHTVMASIINPDQTGYIKNRYIGCNIRNIIDIYEHCEMNNKEGALISIDFKKAFDSLEHNFMFSVLKRFNFGPNFISWIQMLYRDPVFKVKNNGWISSNYKMERGVRQGCPMSSLIFILCTEIMAHKIRTCELIEGIDYGGYNHRICQYADDAVMIVKHIGMVPICLHVINLFCKVAGLELNLKKCKGIWLGPLKDKGILKEYGISWTGNPIKCLGIYIGHKTEKAYYLNWIKRIEQIDHFLTVWSRLNLSLFGKVNFIKTYALSKIIFPASMLSVPQEVVKKLNSMFYNFIWGKRDRVTRAVVCNSMSKGGLGMIDLNIFFTTLKVSWVKRYINCPGKWKSGFEEIAHKINVPSNYLLKINSIKLSTDASVDKFYADVLCSFYKCKTLKDINLLNHNDIVTQPLWFNEMFTYKGKYMFFKEWVDAGILYVKDIVNDKGQVMTQIELTNKIGRNCNIMHQMFMFNNSTVRKLKAMDLSVAPHVKIQLCNDVLIGNKLYKIKELDTKLLYNGLIEKTSTSRNKMESLYNKEFHIENKKPTWNKIYEQKIIGMKAAKLREFNFKMLHNIVPCGYVVSKWNVNVKANCDRCGSVETTKHMLFECVYINNIWDKISSIIKIAIQWKHVVTGFYNFDSEGVMIYNCIISIIVYAIFKEKIHGKYTGKHITDIDLITKIKYNISFYKSICDIDKCKAASDLINLLCI